MAFYKVVVPVTFDNFVTDVHGTTLLLCLTSCPTQPIDSQTLSRFFISPAARQLGIDHRVSDRGVPYPVLHKAEVCARVEQVGGN
jgi:hypothetical protein